MRSRRERLERHDDADRVRARPAAGQTQLPAGPRRAGASQRLRLVAVRGAARRSVGSARARNIRGRDLGPRPARRAAVRAPPRSRAASRSRTSRSGPAVPNGPVRRDEPGSRHGPRTSTTAGGTAARSSSPDDRHRADRQRGHGRGRRLWHGRHAEARMAAVGLGRTRARRTHRGRLDCRDRRAVRGDRRHEGAGPDPVRHRGRGIDLRHPPCGGPDDRPRRARVRLRRCDRRGRPPRRSVCRARRRPSERQSGSRKGRRA